MFLGYHLTDVVVKSNCIAISNAESSQTSGTLPVDAVAALESTLLSGKLDGPEESRRRARNSQPDELLPLGGADAFEVPAATGAARQLDQLEFSREDNCVVVPGIVHDLDLLARKRGLPIGRSKISQAAAKWPVQVAGPSSQVADSKGRHGV